MSKLMFIYQSQFTGNRANSFMQSRWVNRFHKADKKQRHSLPRGKAFMRMIKLDPDYINFELEKARCNHE
jgi:hypothetical protein